MAPSKKSKGVHKGLSSANDSSPTKDESFSQKKRKITLGPQWTKSELHRFYDAYRQYGQDWKKVSVALRNRSVQMVEALYNVNRAYLSLPDGTASAVGLIAMMTDHYNVFDDSVSDKDTEKYIEGATVVRKVQKHQKDTEKDIEGATVARKVQKHQKAKARSDSLRESSSQRRSISSSDRHLSLLKMFDGGQPKFPVKKRTPRIPVSTLDNQPSKKCRGSVMNANDKEQSNGAMLLKEAKPKQNSPHDSQTRDSRSDLLKNSQVSNWDKRSESPALNGGGLTGFEESADGSLSSNDSRIGKFSKELLNSDEQVAWDALQTLAEMSLMDPDLATEPVKGAGESIVGRDSCIDKSAQVDSCVDKSSKGRESLKEENSVKRKRKSKAREPVTHNDLGKQAEMETFADEEVKSGDSCQQKSPVSKRCKLSPDVSSIYDQELGGIEAAVCSTQLQAVNHVMIPPRRKSRRKRDRKLLQKDGHLSSTVLSNKCPSLFQERVLCAKDQISHCLSSPDVRRWCIYEWFYSAIDYPWFAKREFMEYLDHVGLGHIPRLTRDEWGVIRNSLGKPRRFSDRFLLEEREKLKKYRESVRSHYTNLRAGLGEGLPTDLARPLMVGQQVIAVHPKTREVHNGSVLTVDRQSCLIQFDRSDLGVELVLDIDCMPLNPVENMPESLRRQNILYDYRNPQLPVSNGAFMLASNEHRQNTGALLRVPSSVRNDEVKPVNSHAKVIGNGSIRPSEATQSKYPNLAQMQLGKGDMTPGAGLTQGLDRKVIKQHSGSPKNPPCWPLPVANSSGYSGTLHSSHNSMPSCQETSSNVLEIVEGSREKAQKMVDVAIKAMSSMREGEDAYGRIGEALDPATRAECKTNGHLSPMTISANLAQGHSAPQDRTVSCSSEPQVWGNASRANATDLAASDLRVPSDLIASCVGTLLMIQSCTERQYPPAEVAQILDKAVTSLSPCSSQNLSIYREIQMCMGRIKTQILALVPT